MQSAPPGSVELNGCPAWRLAVGAVILAAVAAMAAWAVGRIDRQGAPVGTVHAMEAGEQVTAAVAAAVALGALAAGGSLLRCPNGRLAWSGDRWRFEPRPSGGSGRAWTPIEGTIAVALDLGNVLLLTLTPDDGSPPTGLARGVARAFPRWLPVERRAVEGDWHGLRVALAAGRHR